VPRVYLAGPPLADEYRRRAEALVREAGWEPVDPMRRDFRGRTQGHEEEIVTGDLADIDSCEAVLADFSEPDEGTSAAPYAVFGNAGQDCCARSRILVERSAYDRFLELLTSATDGVKVGSPEDESTEMGPLISADQWDKVSSYVDGNVVYRGNTPQGKGFWFPCTLVEATNDDRVAREEVFGPVAAVIPFEDEADAVRIANDTPYGLSGSVWTENGRPGDAGRARAGHRCPLSQLEYVRARLDAVRRV
jgi:hypothetical protein